MPTYDARCYKCQYVIEYVRSMAECHDTPDCPRCGGGTEKVILTAPQGFVKGSIEPFYSMVDGSLINSQHALSEHNKRNNVVNIHDGYSEERVLAGDYIKPPERNEKADIVGDLKEAIHKVEHGYKPLKQVQEDGN